MPRAFTRAVSPLLAECELTHLERVAIDPEAADVQHNAYEHALADAGFEVIRLADLPDYPDAVFVEDTALLLGDHAVILRPGAASRAGETESTAAGLVAHFELHHLENGFVDGGDVLRIGDTIYVGQSTRTDAAGIIDLQRIVAAFGYRVVEAALRDCLHLKTSATFIGPDTRGTPVLLFDPRSVDPAQFAGVEPIAVDAGERPAANSLRVGDRLIVPAGNPRTAKRLGERGFNIVEIDVSELQKAESGVTCMSLIDDRA
jgi:dimethylargininase